jgi:hypothetical protein
MTVQPVSPPKCASLTCTLYEAIALLAGMPPEIVARYGSKPGNEISGRNQRALDLLHPSRRRLPGTENFKADFTFKEAKWDPKRNKWQEEEERRRGIARLQWDPKRNKWQEEEERRRGIARLQWDPKRNKWQEEEERRWEIARLRLRDEVHLGHVSVYSSDGRKPADYWMYHSFDTEAHLFRYGKTDLEHLMCVDCVEGSGQAALADIENVTAPATSEGSVADTTVLSNSKEPDKLPRHRSGA